MSELIQKNDNRATIRWKLLTGASALVLTAYVVSTSTASADSSHPLLWLDLSGQFDLLTDSVQSWLPPNLPPVIDHPVVGALSQKPRFGYDMDGKITFQPDGSDWSFSAAIQYGKAKKGPKSAHDQTYKTKAAYFLSYNRVLTTYAFTNLHAVEETKHLILDFQAGKDVGLGLFGHRGDSTLNFGVRLAKFQERGNSRMTAQTSVPWKYAGLYYYGKLLNAYMQSTRSFDGVGPSIAWSGSVPIAGSLEDGLTFDWNANAALLFGRQKTKVRTHTDKEGYVGLTYVPTAYGSGAKLISTVLTHSTHVSIRSRRVTVPNLGGLIGLSFRKGDAKVSFGYKADFFFGAIDGGIATAKKENRGFFGPFASISIGIGD